MDVRLFWKCLSTAKGCVFFVLSLFLFSCVHDEHSAFVLVVSFYFCVSGRLCLKCFVSVMCDLGCVCYNKIYG